VLRAARGKTPWGQSKKRVHVQERRLPKLADEDGKAVHVALPDRVGAPKEEELRHHLLLDDGGVGAGGTSCDERIAAEPCGLEPRDLLAPIRVTKNCLWNNISGSQRAPQAALRGDSSNSV